MNLLLGREDQEAARRMPVRGALMLSRQSRGPGLEERPVGGDRREHRLDAALVNFGGRLDLGKRSRLDMFMTENIVSQQSTTDFALYFGLSVRP